MCFLYQSSQSAIAKTTSRAISRRFFLQLRREIFIQEKHDGVENGKHRWHQPVSKFWLYVNGHVCFQMSIRTGDKGGEFFLEFGLIFVEGIFLLFFNIGSTCGTNDTASTSRSMRSFWRLAKNLLLTCCFIALYCSNSERMVSNAWSDTELSFKALHNWLLIVSLLAKASVLIFACFLIFASSLSGLKKRKHNRLWSPWLWILVIYSLTVNYSNFRHYSLDRLLVRMTVTQYSDTTSLLSSE